VIAHLVGYFAASAVYALLCVGVGRTYSPPAAFQVYALGLCVWLVVALSVGRLTGLWRWRRAWPPSRVELLAAAGSVLILTSSTLALLLPRSLAAVVLCKVGPLFLAARDRPVLLVFAALAAAMSVWNAPFSASILPLCLALAHVLGYYLKLAACREARDFDLAAEQVALAGLVLAVAGGFFCFTEPAPISDWRLWGIAAASTVAGLTSTRLLLLPRQSTALAGYKSAGLAAAVAASAVCGHEPIGWSQATAALLAIGVVVAASR